MPEEVAPHPIRVAAPLLLASASPRRAAILRRAGFRFAVVPADDVEETTEQEAATPEATATALAVEKASLIAARHPGAFVLGADTVVVLDGRLLGKPETNSEAAAMLRDLRGRAHAVITGVAVVGPRGVVKGAKTTIVRFRPYSDRELDAYVRGGSPMDKAGAYGIQDSEFAPAAAVAGCYLNVVGLPLCLALALLHEAGALPEGPERWPHCAPPLATGEAQVR